MSEDGKIFYRHSHCDRERWDIIINMETKIGGIGFHTRTLKCFWWGYASGTQNQKGWWHFATGGFTVLEKSGFQKVVLSALALKTQFIVPIIVHTYCEK